MLNIRNEEEKTMLVVLVAAAIFIGKTIKGVSGDVVGRSLEAATEFVDACEQQFNKKRR